MSIHDISSKAYRLRCLAVIADEIAGSIPLGDNTDRENGLSYLLADIVSLAREVHAGLDPLTAGLHGAANANKEDAA